MGHVDPNLVRNVGIAGHSGTGKTTLIEHLLFKAGKIKRAGSVEEKNTVGDYLEEERDRQQTVNMKLMHLEWKGSRIYLVDTPGYGDFIGELAACVPVLDAVIIVVDATTGIQVGTDAAVHYAEKYQIPHAFYVNKLDRDGADFNAACAQIREAYGKQCIPMILPVGEGENIERAISVLEDVEGDDEKIIHDVREEVSDTVAEQHEELLAKYLDTGELSHDEFVHGIQEGIEKEAIIPIIGGSVIRDIGVERLLELMHESFPTPLDRDVHAANAAGGTLKVKIAEDEPFLGEVFHSVADPFVGQLTFFRVWTGTLKSDSEFYNNTTQTKERTGKIFVLNGKEQVPVEAVGPGEIAALTKLKATHFGDIMSDGPRDIVLPRIEIPEGMVKRAIVPKSRADEDKIGEALNRLAVEDPTFTHYRDEETHEHLVKGMGDIQLELMMQRMKSKFNVEADLELPRVAYKETIRSTAEAQGKHKKQSGGHGQYGDVHLRISPNARGEGYVFKDSIVGGVVPRQYIPAVDKGVQECLTKGLFAGYPMVDVTVELYDGSYHDVDSSEMAFKVAASLAMHKAVDSARPCLLEPIMAVEITVPDEFMGDINGDLNSRRGRIMGMEPAGPGRQRIQAHVPEAEMLTYASELRSMTQGRGHYTMTFDHYEEVPEHIAQGIVSAHAETVAAG